MPIDSPELILQEFNESTTVSSKNLLGLVVEQGSACNRFLVREANTGRTQWILSDLEPLYGIRFEGGDLEIVIDRPFQEGGPVQTTGYSRSRVYLIRHFDETLPLPNFPVLPYKRPDCKVVRQVAIIPTTLNPRSIAQVLIEGYKFVSCTVGFQPALVGATVWDVQALGAIDNQWQPAGPPALTVGQTLSRPFATTLLKGNTGGVTAAFDNMTMALEPFTTSLIRVNVAAIDPLFITQTNMSVTWQFSNTPMTERF